MAKSQGFINGNEDNRPLQQSKRTTKKIDGDKFTHNVRVIGLKPKRRKNVSFK